MKRISSRIKLIKVDAVYRRRFLFWSLVVISVVTLLSFQSRAIYKWLAQSEIDIKDRLTVVGGLIVFAVGLWQYRKAQQWKRAEFIAKEIKEFKGQHEVKNVMLMLDWDGRSIELFPGKPKPEERLFKVDHAYVEEALWPHAQNPYTSRLRKKYGVEEAIIRDYFDFFLDYLEQFDYYIQFRLS